MFEKELRVAEAEYRNLERQVQRIINSYSDKLNRIKAEMDKYDGTVEKDIDDKIASIEKEVQNAIREFKKSIDKTVLEYEKMIDLKQQEFISRLHKYKYSIIDEFNVKAEQLMVVKGDL